MGGDKGGKGKGKGKGPESGTVANWLDDKAYGFIKSDSDGNDYFCLQKSLGGGTSLIKGLQVFFSREYNERSGKDMCVNVSGPGVSFDGDSGGKGGDDWGKGDKGKGDKGDWGKGDKGGKDGKGKDKGGKDPYGDPYGDGKGKGPPPPAPAPSSAGEWKTAKDTEGKTYYYNTVTKATQWDPPPGFGGGGAPPPPDKGGKGGDFDKGGKGKDKGGWDDGKGKGKDKGGWDDGKGKGKDGKDKGGWDDGKGKGKDKGGWDDGKGKDGGKGGKKDSAPPLHTAPLGAVPPVQSAPASSPVGLWKETLDKSSGKTYYYNTVTKEVSWDKPAGFQAPAAASAPGAGKGGGKPKGAAPSEGRWKEATDKATGKPYYYHSVTKEVVWDKPAGFSPY